jgi:hypothetical protein
MKLLRFPLLTTFVLVALLVSSCNNVPKYAKYIPKDAFMVLGVHTGKMGKSMAWSAIAGGGMFKDMPKMSVVDSAPAAFRDLENSGLDFTRTLYLYTKPDTRFKDKMKMAIVAPVANTLFVEQYFRKHFPALQIRNSAGLKEVVMDGQYYFAWNEEVLMAMNSIVSKVEHQEQAKFDTLGGAPVPIDAFSWTEEKPDSAMTLAELESAFKPQKGGGINEVERFTDLEKADHDVTVFMNYDPLIDMFAGQNTEGFGMMGTTIGTTLFKGSAMASGFDFEKGRVDGLMRYYSSDSMRPVAKEFAKENVDGDMLRRLPAPGLNLAGGYHLSPAAIKMLLEKMNLSGMANLALMSQGLSLDDILGSFTGDMVFAINNLRMEQKTQQLDSAAQAIGMTPYSSVKPAMDFVFAMKIGDKNRLAKILGLVNKSGMLQQTAPNTYTMAGSINGNTLVIGDKYIAASSSMPAAQAFLKEHAGAMPDAVHSEISGHPVGMWADIRSMLSSAGAISASSPSDSTAITLVRNAFTTFSMQGGEYKDNANEYHLSLHLANTTDNSLAQIIQLAQQLATLNRSKQPSAI